MKLSILIPTIHTRGDFLTRILGILRPQLTADVELLINMDTCARSIGEKRNSMLHSAEGEYVVFVDDDDRVSPNYVAKIMEGIAKGVDVVSIRGEVSKDGYPFGVFIDNPYTRWQNIKQPDNTFLCLRGVQHLDAIKREIALQVRFEDRRFGEDSRWGGAVEATKLVQSWHLIDEPVYYYEWVVAKERIR